MPFSQHIIDRWGKKYYQKTMAAIETGISDDYAVLTSGKYRFYYGYEMTDDEDNWQFGVKRDEELIIRITPNLPDKLQGADPAEILLYCIGGFILKQQR